GGALAFKARTANFHLYTCDTVANRCLIVDGTNTYTIDDTGTSTGSSTITSTDPGSTACSSACPNSVKALVEPK
ncbi:hypothetical protein, partial [Niastella vici]|uniref:hypothetical protein n=1 Tax=Niastella vici TaxID=1703345 RepID=UPI001C1FB1D8